MQTCRIITYQSPIIFFLFVLGFLFPRATQAASFVVTSTADTSSSVSDPHTLRGAIAASQASPDASDTITITATGTVSLTQGELLISNPKNIAGKTVTMIGPGAGSFSVSGNSLSGTNLTRVLHITSGTVALSGVTLTQGHISSGTTGGAGVLLEGATLTMAHCVVSVCGVFIPNSVGGGIANIGGALTLTNCVITGNGDSGVFSAGGIGSENGSLTLQNCTVNSNDGTGLGGGIASSNEICLLTHTTISANNIDISVNDPTGEASGGGVYSNNDSLTMVDCTLSGNQGHFGYGLYIGGTSAKTAHLRNCTLDGNSTFYTHSSYTLVNAGATLFLTNCTIAGNSGQGLPAGFYNSGRLTMTDCTLTNDQSTELYNDTGGTATVTSSILASVFTATPGAIKSGGSNLIGDPDGNGFVNDPHHADPNSAGNHDQTGVTHPGLASTLASNGGLTQTLALIATSPAIDADFADATPTDQRGAPRPFGARNDIGAYESGATAPATVIDTYLVTNTNDSGAGSLRQAIADANADPGASVAFDPAMFGPGKPQTILLTSGPLTVTQNMTITGPGASLLSVSGGNVSRVFILSGPGPITITGLTITGGNSGSQAGSGGGVFLDQSTLIMTDCVISHCTVPIQTGEGGGIFVFHGGGATLTRCVITGNSAPNGLGGGIDVDSNSSFSMTDCTISGNMAKTGGGINFDFTQASTIATSTISGNTATTGGGINCEFVLFLYQCTIAHNTATNGGGIYGIADLLESTVADNTATTGGGLENNTADSSTVFSSILAGNTGGNLVNTGSAVTLSEGYNLIGDSNGNGFTNGVNHDITGVTNPKLGPLQNNGGPTQTIALLPGSPAIDGGQPTTSTTSANTDQRGLPRPQGVAQDIGAYEFGAPSAHDDAYTVQENKPLTVQSPGVLANDTADSAKPILTATLEDKPLHGSLMFNHDGSFSYTPNTGFLGTDTFTYQVADAGVAGTDGTVTLTVVGTVAVPPTTAATLNPSAPNGKNGYYTVPVTITLKATLAAGDPGPATTFYSLDGAAQKTYTAPLKVSTDGAHTLTYFSSTPQGGVEAAKKITFAIDATSPVTTGSMKAVIGGTQITLTAKDNVSGVASTVYTLDGGAQQTYTAPFTVTSTSAHTIVYHSTDKAGNTEKAQTLTVASGTVHTFASGLQMFSVPADYSALSLGASLIQSWTTSAPDLAVWVPSLFNYVLSPTSPADHLRPGQGYWVKLNGTGSLSSMGTPTPTSAPFSIALGEGWNMIGDPFNSTISLSTVEVTAGSKSYSGFGSASSSGVVSYLLYSYPAGSSAYVSEDGNGNLAPYVGYWVYAFQPCTLTITAP